MPSSALPCALRALAVSAIGLFATSAAQAVDTTLRLQGQLVNTSASVIGLSGDFGSGPGAYLGVEFHLNDRLGIEVGAAWIDLEESATPEVFILTTGIEASASVVPITVALDIHLTPQKSYDLYVAPKIGWAFFDDLELTTRFDFGNIAFPGFPNLNIFPDFGNSITTPLATEDQFVFGLRLGFDVPFGDGSWSFSSSIDYTDMELEFEGFGRNAPGVGLDPVAIGAGVAYSF